MCFGNGDVKTDDTSEKTIATAQEIGLKSASATRAFMAQKQKAKTLGYAGSFMNQNIGG